MDDSFFRSQQKNAFLGAFVVNLFFFAFFLLAPLTHATEFTDETQTTLKGGDSVQYFKDCYRAAQKGDSKAQNTLGLLYQKGVGTSKNYPEALKWFQKSARNGNPEGQNNLGFLHFKGIGVKQDNKEALKWFQKSADQGLASAQGNVGLVYGQGLGVKKDYAKALEYFKKAAEQDDPDSQVNLGVLYSLGEGTAKDYVESHKWFSLALRHESLTNDQVEELHGDIEWLEKHMTGKQMDEAKKRETAWKPVFSR
jgi:TPR repeat protein